MLYLLTNTFHVRSQSEEGIYLNTRVFVWGDCKAYIVGCHWMIRRKDKNESLFFISTDDLNIFDTPFELATDTGVNFGSAFKDTDFF